MTVALAVTKRADWSQLLPEFEDFVRQNYGKVETGELTIKQLCTMFAEKHGISVGGTVFTYYQKIRPYLDQILNPETPEGEEETPVDSVQVQEEQETEEQVVEEEKERDLPPQPGEVVECEVTGIESYGAFVRVEKNGRVYGGLIHISEITNEFVFLPEDYFQVGERVKAKVIAVHPNNKLALSTRALGGKRKLNSAGFRLGNDAELAGKLKKALTSLQKSSKENDFTDNRIEHAKEVNIEVGELLETIKKYSNGLVTSRTVAKVKKLVEKYGAVKTALVLVETLRDLDVSYVIAEKMEERLAGECL